MTSFLQIILIKNYASGKGITIRLHSSRNSYLNSVILNSMLLGVYPTTYNFSEDDESKGKILAIEALIGLGIAGLLYLVPGWSAS